MVAVQDPERAAGWYATMADDAVEACGIPRHRPRRLLAAASLLAAWSATPSLGVTTAVPQQDGRSRWKPVKFDIPSQSLAGALGIL